MNRKSGYSTKITKELSKIYVTPLNIMRSKHFLPNIQEEFEVVDSDGNALGKGEFHLLRYNPDGQKCDLCGHEPIKRIFSIKCKSNKKIMEVGSECIKNWIGVDLARGLAKVLDYKKNAIVFQEKYADQIAALTAEMAILKEDKIRNFNIRRIEKILSRIEFGEAVAILESDMTYVCDIMRKHGYEIPIVSKHEKLIENLGGISEPIFEAYDKYYESQMGLKWEERDKTLWRISSAVRNFRYALTSATKFFEKTGCIKQADGRLLRQIDKSGFPYFN